MLRLDDIGEDEICLYDIETDHQYAPYANLKMIGVQYGLDSEPELVESYGEKKRFRQTMANPDILKVQFNGFNFDNLVLYRHGIPVNELNSHDIFLMAKTVAPRLPAYSLKYLNFHYFADTHEPEREINEWCKKYRKSLWEAPKELLTRYCLYDINPQTKNLFLLFWEVVQRPLHWSAYSELECPMGLVMEEIMLRGGEYLDEKLIVQKIATLQMDKLGWEDFAWKESGGKITNPNSTKQVAQWLVTEEDVELALTDKGNFSLKKEDILAFLDIEDHSKDKSQIVRALYEVRQINNTLSYYRNYLSALEESARNGTPGWIPKQYSLSRARTRRILSNSKHKLNFQNPNAAAKEVIIIPPGWLGWWYDATQVENVVHIYESEDRVRRASYEADPNWNEYVWLANFSLGTDYTKKELDNVAKHPFPSAPHWSMYKGFKTLKLAANFGMGVIKLCKLRRITESAGRAAFALLHRACPAIKMLQNKVAILLNKVGYVQDVFGHIYSGPVRQAYKVVAYLIQGCGTGSLPKAQMRANYETLHRHDIRLSDKQLRHYTTHNQDVVVDHHRGIASFGILNGTTHDENSGRISIALGEAKIIATLQEMHYNMTEKFSHKFDNIPLRAKLYLAGSGPGEYATDRIEVPMDKLEETVRKLIYGNTNTTSRSTKRTKTRSRS